jgi:predicted nucleic acid-binding protein
MKYLIDTDISSYYLRGKYNLLNIFIQKGISDIRISAVSVAELEVLPHKNPASKINFSSIAAFSQKLGVLNVDNKTWRLFSKLKADTQKTGTKKGDLDLLIASIALQHSLILITNNVSHYKDLVAVENWIV